MKKIFFSIAALFLIVNGFFVAKMNDYAELRPFVDHPAIATVSVVFVLFFALPSFWALWKWLGSRRAALALLSLGIFALSIETFAVLTGYPYGQFSYGDKIGWKIFGVTPWTVPFAWTPLLLAAFALSRRFSKSTMPTILLTSIITVVFDLVVDPGAVSQKFWHYRFPGIYYGVPFSNFVGWIFSGIIGAAIIHRFARDKKDAPASLMTSAWLILVFWSSVCAWSALWIPAIIGVLALCVASRYLLFHGPEKPNA